MLGALLEDDTLPCTPELSYVHGFLEKRGLAECLDWSASQVVEGVGEKTESWCDAVGTLHEKGVWWRLPVVSANLSEERGSNWMRAFHGSHIFSLGSVLLHGLRESPTGPGRNPGVYCFKATGRKNTGAHTQHTLMPNGTAWSVVYELLVDRAAEGAGKVRDQWYQPSSSTRLVAVWLPAFSARDLCNLRGSSDCPGCWLWTWDALKESALEPEH